MKIKLHISVFLLFALIAFLSKGVANTLPRGERPPINFSELPEDSYEPGVLLIKIRPELENFLISDMPEKNDKGNIRFGLKKIDSLNQEFRVEAAIQYFASGALKNGFTAKHKDWGFHLWYKITVDNKTDIVFLLNEYLRTGEVEVAEPEFKKVFWGDSALTILDQSDNSLSEKDGSWIPNDPQFGQQWHYNNTGEHGGTPGADISLSQAWLIEKGNPDVLVAVLDGGIDYNHEDLAGNMWEGIGFNFVDNNTGVSPHPHGTHVAGTVGAVSNNNKGVSGVAGGSGNNDGVRLLSAQLINASGTWGGSHIAPIWAADQGAAISQNSWSYSIPNVYQQSELDAIDYFNANGGGEALLGGISIFAAGNGNTNTNIYPGYYSGTFTVAATDANDKKAFYSNYGTWIDISAPGGHHHIANMQVLSTLPGNQYGYMAGTSMACPHVSGVAALMISRAYGKLTPEDIKEILLNTTDDISGLNPLYLNELGKGRLNAHHALTVTANYLQLPQRPANLNAEILGENDILIHWDLNEEQQPVLLAYSKTGNFGIPPNQTWFQVGDSIPGGGHVLMVRDKEEFLHSGLDPGTRYYYRLWTIDNQGRYSFPVNHQTQTKCESAELPLIENFSQVDIPSCWLVPNGRGNWRKIFSGSVLQPGLRFTGAPALSNYSFPLESPKMNGNVNPGHAIILSFEMSFTSFAAHTEEKMVVDVWDGENWHTVKTFFNINGSFPQSSFTIDITEVVRNKDFSVRFTATGSNSIMFANWTLFNFHVYSMPFCNRPVEISKDSVSSQSATITWEPGGVENLWNLKWGESGFDPQNDGILIEDLTETSYLLDTLSPSGSYDVYLKALCGSSDESQWTYPFTFSTLPVCPAPDVLTINNLTSFSASFSWQPAGSETQWSLIWGEKGFDPENEGTLIPGIVVTEYTLENLSAFTEFDLYVMAECNEEEQSQWSPVFSFLTLPTCFAPENLTVNEISHNSAVINWAVSYGNNTWDLIWGTEGFNPENDGNIEVSINETTFTIENLEPFTSYDVYLRANCNEDDSSVLSDPLNFKTHCNIIELPFAEMFDGDSQHCWISDTEQSNWVIGNSYPPPSSFSGKPHLSFRYDPLTEEYSYTFLSPVFFAPDPALPVLMDLVVFIDNNNDDSVEYLAIELHDKSTEEWQTLQTFTNEGLMGGNSEFIILDLEIPEMQQKEFQIRFRAYGSNSNSINAWSIDDIIIYQEYPYPSCDMPYEIQVSNITTSSAEISWEANDYSLSYSIIYGVSGFDPETDGIIISNIPESSHLIEGLEQNSGYDFFVRSHCPYNRQSQWAGPFSFSTNIAIYIVSAGSGDNGSIDPSGDIEIEHGGDQQFTITPYEGFHILKLFIDDQEITEEIDLLFDGSGIYNLLDVKSDKAIYATFQINSYDVNLTPVPAEGGTVSGFGTYEHGAQVLIQATAAESFKFIKWSENDTDISFDPELTIEVKEERNLIAHFEATTSTDEYLHVNRIVRVYPNPAQNRLWIELPDSSESITEIIIQNIHGQIVLKELLIDRGTDKISIDITGIPSGIYLLKALPDYQTHKIIIKK